MASWQLQTSCLSAFFISLKVHKCKSSCVSAVMHFALGGSKKRLCGDCDVYGSQLDVKKSLFLDRADRAPIFQNKPRTSKGFVPSVLSLSENTAQLTSDWFHSSECYQLCIKCVWRARCSCHNFQAAITLCIVLPFLRHKELHLIFSNICFSFFFFSGINLSPQQTTVLLKRGSAPFLQEQVTNAKKKPAVKWLGRFQTLIGVVGMKIHITLECAVWDTGFFSMTDQKRAWTAAFSLGNVLPRILYTSIQMYGYVCACKHPLISLLTGWLISVISPLVKKSAAVPLKIHSSIIDEEIRSQSSEYPVYGKSEVLLGHVTSVRRNAQQPFLNHLTKRSQI